MSDFSGTASDLGSAVTSSQRDRIEDVVQRSEKDDAGKAEPSSQKDIADDPEHASRYGDGDATKSSQGSQRGMGDENDMAYDEVQKPWDDLLEYMIHDKSPEYNAEGLVTLWNAQYDDGSESATYMAADFDMFSDGDSGLIDKVFDKFAGTMGSPFEIRLAGGLEDDRSKIEQTTTVDKNSLDNERSLLSAASPLLPLKTAAAPDHPFAWIGNNVVYKSWCKQRKPRLLYLHGESDTQLASEYIFYDIDNLGFGESDQIVLYFSFDRYDIRRDSIQAMIATFLAQMAGHFPTLAGQFRSQFEQLRVDRSWNYADLLNWFERLRTSGQVEGISCVINHFDECEPVSRKAFLDRFIYVSETQERPWGVIVTTRQPGALLEELSNWPVLDLTSSAPEPNDEVVAHSYEISLLRQRPEARCFKTQIEEELKAVAALEPEIQELVINHVSRNEHWPSQRSISDILGPLEGMTLESVIGKILSNVPEQEQVLHALSWILYATRPPTVWELATAVTVGIERMGADDPLSTTRSAYQLLDKLQSWLAGIVTLQHNEVVISTRHIREALMAKPSAKSGNPYSWDIRCGKAHSMIARTCLVYLTSAVVNQSLGRLYDNSHYNEIHLAIICDRTSLQDYATHFWAYHLPIAATEYDPAEDIALFIKSGALPNWSRAHWVLANPLTRSQQPFNSLYPILAGVGLADQAEKWCNGEEDLSAGLIEACLNGSSQTIRQLLPRMKHSVESLNEALIGAGAYADEAAWIELVNYIKENYPEFPWEIQGGMVCRASWLGLTKVLAKLLEVGCPADAEHPGRSIPVTPLHLATRTNNINASKLLLEHKANPNHAGLGKETPLHWAASYGHPEMIKLLADYGADLNARDDKLFVPIFDACLRGNSKAVEALVTLKADPNLKTVENQDDPGWSPLTCASAGNHVDCVRALLEANADPEILDDSGTPLLYAVASGSLEICQLLLEKGASPNHESITPPILVQVIGEAKCENRLDIVRLLIEREARVNAEDTHGNTALWCACWLNDPHKLSIAEYLLEHGADVNCRNHGGTAPVHIAISRDDVRLLRLLLEQKDVNLNTWDIGKATPLMRAVKSEEMTRMLLEKGADPNIRPDGDDPVLLHAVQKDQTEVVRLLVQYNAQIDPPDESRTDSRWEPMEAAVAYGRSDIIRVLAEGGADINRRFAGGRTLTHIGLGDMGLGALLEFRPILDVKSDYGDAPLHGIEESTPIENVKLLVRAGSDINLTNSLYMTPLTQALSCGHGGAARYYLSKKADADIVSPGYGGPLHNSCRGGLVDLVKEFIAAGADVNLAVPGIAGTPLSSIFVGYGPSRSSDETKMHLMNILLEAGADINGSGGLFGTVAEAVVCGGKSVHLTMLVSKGASLLLGDSMGRQPLHLAAAHGKRDMLSLILDAGGEATARDKSERNAVSWAAQGGRIDILSDLLQLSGNGAINEPDADGWTPLCWAARGVGTQYHSAEGGQYEMIKELLDRGADRSVKSRVQGKEYTPAGIARYHGCGNDIMELLTPDKGVGQPPNGDGMPTFANNERLRYDGAYCDFCLFVCYGFRYTCKTCIDFDFCYKCYNSKHKLHWPGHEFEKKGPEFIVDSVAPRSRSSSPAPSSSEISSTSASDSDDESEDEEI
ncbi:hypothetical protein DL765_004442 [Monosporascus sp. GIB2]|nr:hypothetical protein DL765_004442 [Monosporascus sp. GIB2]